MLYQSEKNNTELKIVNLNKIQQSSRENFLEVMGDKQGLKELKEKLKKQAKKSLKNRSKSKTKAKPNKRLFVLDFDGDVKASGVDRLREEISTLICVAKEGDEVVIRLESGGGMVHAYGLAAAQLIRLKEAGFTLTVCVDKIAASGGYMMACVADKIIASPFAVIGSIGVIAQLPNFHKLLKKNDVDFEMFTAGDFKRTVTVFGENNDKNREKFQEELEQTHILFKDFVCKYRPEINIELVATGEHWYGEDAVKNGLVDVLLPSDSYILQQMQKNQIYAISTEKKPTLAEKLGFAGAAQAVIDITIDKIPEYMNKIEQSYFK